MGTIEKMFRKTCVKKIWIIIILCIIGILKADIIDELIDKNSLKNRIKIEIEQTNVWTQIDLEKTSRGIIYLSDERVVLKYSDDNYQMKIENGNVYVLDTKKNMVIIEEDNKYNFLNLSMFMEQQRKNIESLSESQIIFDIEDIKGKIYVKYDKDKIIKELEYVDYERNRVIYKIIEIIDLKDNFKIDIDLNDKTEYMYLNGR
ncbi:MAG: hypothetical protein PHR06_02755 [Candidatus Cloacimonetes bacterium]|nr:hypothetical protein [Candidatus Cloacimonadota bacterium]